MFSFKISLLLVAAAIVAVSCVPYQVVVHREIEPVNPVVIPKVVQRPVIIPQTTTDSNLLGLNILGMKAGLDTNIFDFLGKK